MTPSISIYQVNYVLALHKTGSFSEAAEQCHISQSTLSTMIKKLENQMDIILFDRKTKPIQLTKEGLELISQFKILYNEYENLIEQIQSTKKTYHGSLKIGIIPTIAPFLLPLFLDRLLTKYKNVDFNIFEITTNEITNRIKTRELDIGILSIPIVEENIKQITLFEEEFLIYDTRSYSTKKKTYKINDIDLSRLWLLEEGHCMSNQIGKICHLRKQSKINDNLIFNSGSILSLLELVNLNKGITLLPKLATLQSNIVNPNYIYQIISPTPVRKIGMVTHNNFTKHKLFKVLEEEILKAVNPVLRKIKKSKVVKPF